VVKSGCFMPVQLVWFKKDLRVEDHAPLAQAVQQGPVLALYVYEPQLWQQDDAALCHAEFLATCLDNLQSSLRALGGRLLLVQGEMIEVLQTLHQNRGVVQLWSHEETGNGWSFERDKAVGRWCQANGIPWQELPQNGVIRRLKSRDQWASQWRKRMQVPLVPALTHITFVKELNTAGLSVVPAPLPQAFLPQRKLEETGAKKQIQAGGRTEALSLLHSFLNERGLPYSKAMASPISAETHCSRLSPHLAFGTLSMKEVVQATWQQHAIVKDKPNSLTWQRALTSFEKRLAWHCHFIQKLESEPALEFHPMCRAYEPLIPQAAELNKEHFEAWATGQTGLPMVDACMRMLLKTGWINFRMRAFLSSIACHHLALPWRPVALHLARHFVDYEPGIHYSQIQMQAGLTGINALRIYSPVKQQLDQDPTGAFVRQYVPELEAVPLEHLHEPHLLPPLFAMMSGFKAGLTYPQPIVEPKQAYNDAKARLYAIRQQPAIKAEAKLVYEKHGSRKKQSFKKPTSQEAFS
jgi:deoxyribodipyrimidine photo-lyase